MQLYLPPDNRYRALDQYLMDGKIRRIFLVCGKSLRRLPAGAYFEALEVRLGIRVVTFSDFSPNPSYESVVDGTSRFREAGCDFIAAAGGGSAIDVAKCVKRFANMELTRNCLEQTAAPGDASLLAIPTTAGTGSEATRFAVIYYQGRKHSVAHDDCLPNAVLLDPRLLETLPEYHRKVSMLDALCHAVESVWSLRASPESRDYACRAIRQLLGSMDDYLQNTPDGNLNMLEAANLAGKAINLAQTTAGHALCYGLTSLYGLAHGHAAALCVRRLWPYMVQNVKLSARPAELENAFRALAEAMDCDSAEESVTKYGRILDSLGLPAPETKEEEYAVLTRTVNTQRLQNNPVPLDAADIEALYRQIL
ncbi:MAG: phosphonoacetaldehyde reductase [Oscillospiraceae bacterium]|jgi:alcohol dehydrogenase class IV|nr:phosphonoacetaldehyde reductase [Oscillospiraceae bacterium]